MQKILAFGPHTKMHLSQKTAKCKNAGYVGHKLQPRLETVIGERSSRRKRLSSEPFLAEFELAQRPTKLLLTLGTCHYDELLTLVRNVQPCSTLLSLHIEQAMSLIQSPHFRIRSTSLKFLLSAYPCRTGSQRVMPWDQEAVGNSASNSLQPPPQFNLRPFTPSATSPFASLFLLSSTAT